MNAESHALAWTHSTAIVMMRSLKSAGLRLIATYAPVAQLDRVSVSETGGRGFESRRAHHSPC